ncbi:MAG: RNA recognition motif domain-containing protein [Parachlamydiaceae bacterium]
MKKKLFVGNLPWKATEDGLKTLFADHGEVVSVKIVIDQYTGKSKGFGFIEMASAEEAEAALNALNEKPFMDRNLRVSLAQERPQGDRPPRQDRGDRGGDRGERRSYGGDRERNQRFAR